MTLAEPSGGDHDAPTPREDAYVELRLDLTRAVRRICPPWLANHSEDIVQTALIRITNLLAKRESTTPLASAYLRKAAYSALVDEIRVLRRRQEVPLPEEDQGVPPPQATEASPERRTASREIGQGILECLGRLKKERRLAVTLHLQGHTVPEAAKILGWSTKNTENLVYRGLEDLRICLSAKGFTP